MIERKKYIQKIKWLLEYHPIVALVGARQVGKSTLAQEIAKGYAETSIFDLEDPVSFLRLQEPMLALQHLRGLVIIDEIQHAPDLFTGLWTNSDLVRARARGRDRARPNPINLFFVPIWSTS